MEQTLLGTAGFLVAGMISPGPNNFMVLREAVRTGWRGAVPAIFGVVAGGLALLLLTSVGVGVAVEAEPRLTAVVALAGCAYLGVLGVRLVVTREGESEFQAAHPPIHRTGARGLFVFQFLNPKAWLLVLTVSASAHSTVGSIHALPLLIALFVFIPTLCLGLWSCTGVALTRLLGRRSIRIWFDRSLGVLLVGSALLLLLETWR